MLPIHGAIRIIRGQDVHDVWYNVRYVCNLPVHQDGSCNGLQHYAALGRDALGGAAVNLTPSEQPQDVYTGVLKEVRPSSSCTSPDAWHPHAFSLLRRSRF